MAVHRAIDERVSSFAIYFQFEPVGPEQDIGGGEGDPLVAVDEAVIVAERLHQRCRLFFNGVVVAGLRTEDSGLNSALVEDTMSAAKSFDQVMLHQVDFGYRQVLRHLLGETLKKVSVAGHGSLEGVHYLRADKVLRRNHIAQIELERLLENMPFRLPILFGNRNELIVELGIDLRSKLLGLGGWHGPHLPV